MSSSGRRAAPKRISRDVVLEAGLEALSGSGFHGASMRLIATAADTSLSNLYNYFPSKAHLLAEILMTTATDLHDRLADARTSATGGPSRELDALVGAYVDFIVDQPRASVVGISEIRYLEGVQRDEVTAVRDSTEQLFREVIARGTEVGEFATPFPREAARAVVSLCSSLSVWYRSDGELDRDAIAQRYASFARGLVGAGVAVHC